MQLTTSALDAQLAPIKETFTNRTPHTEKLDYVGIDLIIELIDMGYKVNTTNKKRSGILNYLGIPVSAFHKWVRSLPESNRLSLQDAMQAQSLMAMEAMNEKVVDAIDEIESIQESFQDEDMWERDPITVPIMVKVSKDKADLAGNHLDRLVRFQNANKDNTPETRQRKNVNVEVHTSDSSIEKLKQLQQLKDND